MNKYATFKRAAEVLREQQAEIHELREKIARAEKAEQIVRTLIENDELLAEDVLKKLSELKNNPLSDLEVMEKAASLYRSSVVASFGHLSNISEGSSNPLLDYLLSES